MLTSVAYRRGRVPATQQQFSPVCLPHTIFTAYAKRPWGGTGTWANFSRSGWVSRSALERVCFLAISTSAKGLWGDERHACVSATPPASLPPPLKCLDFDGSGRSGGRPTVESALRLDIDSMMH